MNIARWVSGIILLSLLFYLNFYVFEAEIYIKLINVILLGSVLVLFRVIAGPTSADRIVAVDIFGVLIIGMLALFGLRYNQSFFLDIGLIWALLSFIATLAFAKTLEGRQLDD